MYFKKAILFYVLIGSLVFGQHYFNRVVGNRVSNYSAESIAMGGVGFINNSTASVSITNPAFLMKNKGFQIDANFYNMFMSEYRSFPAIDGFENTFSDLTYVYNSNTNSLSNIGLMYVGENIGFSASTGPFISTDYTYIEEIRNSDDELEGYYQFETSGTINCNSFGLGIALDKNVYIGFSVNKLENDTLKLIRDDLAENQEYNSWGESKKEFISISALIKLSQNTEFAFGFEEDTRFEYINFNIKMDETVNLPEFVYNSEIAFSELYKPSYFRFGFKHTANQLKKHSISLEYEKADYSKYEIDSFKLLDTETFSVGVEYLLYNFPPLRVGLTHKTSPFRDDLSTTIFSTGTGWNYHSASLDIGCRYWSVSYPYPDIFSSDTDQSNPFSLDTVKENNLELVISLQVRI